MEECESVLRMKSRKMMEIMQSADLNKSYLIVAWMIESVIFLVCWC